MPMGCHMGEINRQSTITALLRPSNDRKNSSDWASPSLMDTLWAARWAKPDRAKEGAR